MNKPMVYVSRQNDGHSQSVSSRFFPEKSVRSAYSSSHGFLRPSETEDMLRVRASVMVDGLNHMGNRMIHARLLSKAWMAWVLRFRLQLVTRDTLYQGYRRRQWTLLRKHMHSWKQILYRQVDPRMEYLRHFCFRRMLIRCMRASFLAWKVYCRSRRTACLYIVRGYYAYRRRHNAKLHCQVFNAWAKASASKRSVTEHVDQRRSRGSTLLTALDGTGMHGTRSGAHWAFRLWKAFVFSSGRVATALIMARRRQADATSRVLRCFRTAREYVFLVLSFRYWFALTLRRIDAQKQGNLARVQKERWLLRICLLRWSSSGSSRSSDEIREFNQELRSREAEWREETHEKVREAFAENHEQMNKAHAKMSEQAAEIKALKDDYQERVRKLYEQVEQREAEANLVCRQKELESRHLRSLLSGENVSEIEGTVRQQEINLIKAEVEENNEMILARQHRAMEEEMAAMQEHTQRERKRISSELLETRELLVRMTEQDRMTQVRETSLKLNEVSQLREGYQSSRRGASVLTATEAMRPSNELQYAEQPEDGRAKIVLVSQPEARRDTRQMLELFEGAPPATASRRSHPRRDFLSDLRTESIGSGWRDDRSDNRRSRSMSAGRTPITQAMSEWRDVQGDAQGDVRLSAKMHADGSPGRFVRSGSAGAGRNQVLEYLDRVRERSSSPVNTQPAGYTSVVRSNSPPLRRDAPYRQTGHGSQHRERSQGSSASRRRMQGGELASPDMRETRTAPMSFVPANPVYGEMRERHLSYGPPHEKRAVPESDTDRTQSRQQEGHQASVASYGRRGTWDVPSEEIRSHGAPNTSCQYRSADAAPVKEQDALRAFIASPERQRDVDADPAEQQGGRCASIASPHHQRNSVLSLIERRIASGVSYQPEGLPLPDHEDNHSRATFPPVIPLDVAREEGKLSVPHEQASSALERTVPHELHTMLPQAIGQIGRGRHIAADPDEHLVVSICSQTFSYVPDPPDNLIEIALANFHNNRVNKMFFAKVSSGSYFYGRIHCRLQEVGQPGSAILMVETATSGTFGLQEFVEKYEMVEFLAAEARFLEEEKRKRRKKKREKKQKEQDKKERADKGQA